MQDMRAALSTIAEWVQPKALANHYELWSPDALWASLTFRSMSGTLATAETAEGRWTYKRVGFLNPRITVRVEGAEDDVAIYQPRFWGDGTLAFQAGPSFSWKPTNFWGTQWSFFDAQGSTVMSFAPGIRNQKLGDLFKTQFTLNIVPGSPIQGVVSILTTLGMYLLILHHQDAAAAGAIAASA